MSTGTVVFLYGFRIMQISDAVFIQIDQIYFKDEVIFGLETLFFFIES